MNKMILSLLCSVSVMFFLSGCGGDEPSNKSYTESFSEVANISINDIQNKQFYFDNSNSMVLFNNQNGYNQYEYRDVEVESSSTGTDLIIENSNVLIFSKGYEFEYRMSFNEVPRVGTKIRITTKGNTRYTVITSILEL